MPPPAVGHPLRLHPFRAMRLSPQRVGDPASARAFARPYRAVAGRLRSWERAGHVTHDTEPGLYLHEYSVGGLTVRGLVGALDLSRRADAIGDRAVLPHEGVHPRQVAELATRMAEMQMNPAPILLAHRGPVSVRRALQGVRGEQPLASFTDKQQHQHRVWALRDPDLLELVSRALAPESAVIADGHHRHAAYLELQADHPGTAWDRGLAMLVDQEDTPLFLGPIHRAIQGPRWGTWLETTRGLGAQTSTGPRADILPRLGPQTLVLTDGRRWAAVRYPETDDHQGAVEWLERQLLPALPRRPAAVRYHHTVETALTGLTGRHASSRRGPGRIAALLPAADFDHVAAVAAAGHLMPQKATSFQPKPGLGVFMRSLRDE